MGVVRSVFNGLIAFFAMIFSGRTGRVVTDLLSVATAVVRDLDKVDMPAETKRRTAFQRIKAAALAAGLEAADHAINYLIEQEVTKKRGDSLEAILDGGLEVARQVVQDVQARTAGIATADSSLSLDERLFSEAFHELGGRLTDEGKSYLSNPRTINLLIEAAVASFKKE